MYQNPGTTLGNDRKENTNPFNLEELQQAKLGGGVNPLKKDTLQQK